MEVLTERNFHNLCRQLLKDIENVLVRRFIQKLTTCPCQKLHPHGLEPDVTLLHSHPSSGHLGGEGVLRFGKLLIRKVLFKAWSFDEGQALPVLPQ
jgi:hypothetical protein